jgi:hypothetical protein
MNPIAIGWVDKSRFLFLLKPVSDCFLFRWEQLVGRNMDNADWVDKSRFFSFKRCAVANFLFR